MRGPSAVDEASDRAGAFLRGGTIEFEDMARFAVSDLGYVFHIERVKAKVGESDELRRPALTTRPHEEQVWRTGAESPHNCALSLTTRPGLVGPCAGGKALPPDSHAWRCAKVADGLRGGIRFAANGASWMRSRNVWAD